MKLKGKIDMMGFLKELKKCTGEVFFETPDGDCLALKSALSQYIFCTIANEPELFKTGTLRFEYESDIALLLPWIEEI